MVEMVAKQHTSLVEASPCPSEGGVGIVAKQRPLLVLSSQCVV